MKSRQPTGVHRHEDKIKLKQKNPKKKITVTQDLGPRHQKGNSGNDNSTFYRRAQKRRWFYCEGWHQSRLHLVATLTYIKALGTVRRK